ncbi:hypothetical protein ACFWIA_27940 [Streptomyces sp. NPDC127068]|uniref:hypothetical protein n=1 Tax=Streptomyces sp. NPDC127068 TaxID=3347127 RepID=UPI003666E6F6
MTPTPTSPAPQPQARAILRVHFPPTDRPTDQAGVPFQQLLGVLNGISAQVEPQREDRSAYADLTGALRFWNLDVHVSAGAGPTRALAAMAADVTPPGTATIIDDTRM